MVVVALEGLPCCGKSSILAVIKNRLQIPVSDEVLDEDGIPLAHGKRGSRSQEFYVGSDMRKWNLALQAPLAVIDRSYLSTLAYSKCRGEENLVRELYPELPEPDYFIYLMLPTGTSLRRVHERQPHLTGIWCDETTLRQTVEYYEGQWKNRDGRVFKVDATRPLSQVCEEVIEILQKLQSM